MALSAKKIAAKRGVSAAPTAGQGVPLSARGGLSTDLVAPDVRHYATPFAPAPTPTDYNPADALNAPFQNGGVNTQLTDNSYSPLCWYFTPGGKKRVEGAIAGVPIGDVIVTLPQPFWPARDYIGPVLSADGTTQMGVSISATTGAVTLLEPAGAVLGASGVTAGTYGDATHVAQTTVNAQGLVTSIASVVISSGGAGVTSIQADSNASLTGSVTLASGSNVTLAEGGNTITINASGTAGSVEYDYVQNTSTVTVSSTSSTSPTTVIDGNSVTYDGSTRVKIEFWSYSSGAASGGSLTVDLWDGSTDLGRLCLSQPTGGGTGEVEIPLYGVRFLTPSAAAHTYHVKAFKSGSGACEIYSGAGGVNTGLPMWYRITKA